MNMVCLVIKPIDQDYYLVFKFLYIKKNEAVALATSSKLYLSTNPEEKKQGELRLKHILQIPQDTELTEQIVANKIEEFAKFDKGLKNFLKLEIGPTVVE